MKYREKIVQSAFLDDEERVIKKLQSIYAQALKEVTNKSNILQKEIYKIQEKYNSVEDEKERELLQSQERSKVYQKRYQDSLKTQISSILDTMHQNEFKTVNEYLNECYDKSFVGNMYVLQEEGIPLIVPIDQEQVTRAVQINSKLSKGLYSRLGEDVNVLKKKITSQISRGIAIGMTYQQMAKQLAGYTRIGYHNAVRITRTEGHRVQQEATMDACYTARNRGANVVKQWDATMDSVTRESHQMVDGEIRELDEKFSNGLRFPGDPRGSAAEVINCRCVLLQRARWALDQEELDRLKKRAEQFGLDKTKNFEEFRRKYLKAQDEESVLINLQKMNQEPLLSHKIAEIDYRKEKVTFKDLTKWRKTIGNITEEEQNIISGMNETGYIRNANAYKINSAMRNGTVDKLSDASRKTIETLKEVISKNKSDTDAVLMRKLDYQYIEKVFGIDTKNLKNAVEELNSKKIGEIFTEKGFVSTSYKAAKNLNSNDNVILDIYAPKGTNMFLTRNREESEIILQAGTRFELKGAMLTDDNKIKLLVDVKNKANSSKTIASKGQSSTMKMNLQFFAKIPDEKLTGYALNMNHPTGKEKAKAFREALGYTQDNYTDLKTKILESFNENELVYKREDKYGKRYEQIMQIKGPNGKTANVLTAWIRESDSAEPRLTSIYVDKR